MKIAIYGNMYQEDYLNRLSDFLDVLSHSDITVEMESTFYNYLSTLLQKTPHVDGIIAGDDVKADMAISIGGDGTFLRTARWVGMKQIPILGINTGHLGYLADVTVDEMITAVDDLTKGLYKIENRSLIEVTSVRKEAIMDWSYALNEVAILKQDTSSMISVATRINDVDLATYMGDGLIISTPTGSTGYNLSVGGPILEPTAPNWVISPIAAHSLNMRPLVVRDSSELSVTTSSRATNYRVSLDGRSVTLPVGTTIKLRKAPFEVKVVQRMKHSFTDTLRDKLLWGVNSNR
ncbi:MAG: NAD kinase [Bacteroidales bacterium]|nr:NAD kinase [Bacteroidales bacterium]